MKKTIIKKIIVLVALMFIILSVSYRVNAISLSDMEKKAGDFLETGSKQTNINYTKVTSEFVELGKILTTIGAGVMVAVTTYMGIKYLTAGPEAQAKLKIQLIGLVVSGMVIFGAYFIWKIVINIASNF